jgi:hypothetical protein
VLHAEGRQRSRVKNEEIVTARIDVATGMAFSQIVMFCIIATSTAVIGLDPIRALFITAVINDSWRRLCSF